MDTFASDVKQNIKESLTERFEASTGIVGEALQQRRARRERDKQIQKKLNTINGVTERLQNRSSSISSIEITLTQISLNLQNIIVSFGEKATLQAETDTGLLLTRQQQQRERKQQYIALKDLQSTQKEDEENNSLLDSLAKLLGVFPFGKKVPKPPKKVTPKARAKNAAKKAYKAALKKGASKEAAKQAARQAQQKALQRALAKEAADKAAKEAAKQAAEKAAKEAAEKAAKEAAEKAAKQAAKEAADKAAKEAAEKAAKKAAKEAAEKAAKELEKKAAKETVKKLAVSKLASTIGKIGAKSIPFVGAAVGVGFAAWKLVQGDYVGAGVEAVSGLGSAATAIPATIYSTAREIYYETYGVWPEADSKQSERWPALYITVREAGEELIGKKIDPQPPTPEAKPKPAAVSQAPTTPPSPQPPPATVPSTATTPAVASPSIATTVVPPAAAVGAPAGAMVAKPPPASAGMSGVAGQLASSLESFGITNPYAKQAIIATAAKESGLNPAAKESGAGAYLKTLASRGLDYIYLVFPQLKPGGRVAKNLGFASTGVPKETIEKEWSRGDESFFEMVYGGLGTNSQIGDGYKYRGRGFIQLTGRKVYENAGKEVGVDLAANPDIVSENFNSATAALAGYFFMARGGKQKALSALNSFTDQTEALKWTLNTVAGLGHKASEFDVVGSHLNEQLRKASKFLDMSATAVASAPPPTVGTDVGKTTVAVNTMKQQKTQGNDVTVVNIKEKQFVHKQASAGGSSEPMRAVG